MLQHTFQSGRKMKKKEPTNLCGGGGLCKLGKGDRRSHVRLAVSQAGAILTDKSKKKGGDSGGLATREPLVANGGLGIWNPLSSRSSMSMPPPPPLL